MTTLVTFLLDRSGSMNDSGKRDIAIDSFNEYLAGLKKDPNAEIIFTRLQFDSYCPDCVEQDFMQVPVTTVTPLDHASYTPRGGTPLIDACMKSIALTEEAVKNRIDKPKVIVCFHTDGLETGESRTPKATLSERIREKIAEGWEFNFFGVGMDAYSQAASYGIPLANTVSANMAERHDTLGKFRASASNAANYATGMATSTAYQGHQRTHGDAQLYAAASAGNFDEVPHVPEPAPVSTELEKKLKEAVEKNRQSQAQKPVETVSKGGA